jgi:hypothetical protein
MKLPTVQPDKENLHDLRPLLSQFCFIQTLNPVEPRAGNRT